MFDDRYAYSEMLMYKISLLERNGEYQRALSLLTSRSSDLLDKLAVQEQRAGLHLKRGEFAEAEKLYRELLAGNPEMSRITSGCSRLSKWSHTMLALRSC